MAMKRFSSPLITTAVITLLLSADFVFAFSEPSSSAPQNNVSAPINISNSGQLKSGGLSVNTGNATANALVIPYGNVGLGIITPGYKLDVVGPGTGIIRVAPTGTNAPAGIQFDSTVSTGANSNVGQIFGQLSADGAQNSRLGFNIINTNGTGYTEALSIKSGGNIGIGNTNPQFKLDLGGAASSASGYDKLTTRNIELYTPTTPGAGDGIITLHHGGIVAHQLRYNNGTLYLEASSRPGYGTSGTPNFVVGGTVKASAFTDLNGNPVGGNSQWTTNGNNIQNSNIGTVDAKSSNGGGGYISSGNYGGTGNAAYFPSGLWSNGGSAWIYGNIYTNNTQYDTNVLDGNNNRTQGVQAIRDAGGGWIRTYGQTGWYNGTYGGGWNMTDSSWLRTYGAAGIWANGATIGTNGSFSSGYGGAAGPAGGGIFAGSVGIGTNGPVRKLDIQSGNSDGITFGQPIDNVQAIQTYIDGHWGDRSTYAGGCCNVLALQPDAGNVGIGTTNAWDKLLVNGGIVANRYGDQNNNGYYVIPSGFSYLNSLGTNSFNSYGASIFYSDLYFANNRSINIGVRTPFEQTGLITFGNGAAGDPSISLGGYNSGGVPSTLMKIDNYNNRITMQATGVGIGTTWDSNAWGARLEISDNTSDNRLLYLTGANKLYGHLIDEVEGPTGSSLYIMAKNNTSATTNMTLFPSGNVALHGDSDHGYSLNVAGGAIKNDGSPYWAYTSDARLKKDITPLSDSLDKLLELHGVSYQWIDPSKHDNSTGTQMGFIAQDVEKIFPDWVKTGTDGYKSLNPKGLEALTTEAIRELKNKSDSLEKDVELLKQQHAADEQKIQELEKRILNK